MTTPRRKPELLAPAGDRTCITAAVENGADAVYFGLESGFNAREPPTCTSKTCQRSWGICTNAA
jgi:collagenase-like PrtC family protease